MRKNFSKKTGLIFLLVFVLGAVLRLARISQESIWFDELLGIVCLNTDCILKFFRCYYQHDITIFMPVYFTLQYGWSRIAGASPLAIRALSLLFGLGALPLIYAFAHRIMEHKKALLAMAFLSLSLVHVYYSQEVRYYALLFFLILLSAYSVVRAVQEESRSWWGIHLATDLLITFTHIFAILFFVPVAALLLLYPSPRRWRRLPGWTLAHFSMGILLLIWLFFTLRKGTAPDGSPQWLHITTSWLVRPSLRELANAFVIFSGGRFSNESPALYMWHGISLDLPLALLYLLFTGCTGWFLLRMLIRRPLTSTADIEDRKTIAILVFLFSWLLFPSSISFLVAYFWRPCFLYRYILYSVPAFCLLTAWGVFLINEKKLRYGIIAVMISLHLFQATILFQGPFRPNYVRAIHYIDQHYCSGERVLILKNLNADAFFFNLERQPVKHLSRDFITVQDYIGGFERAVQESLQNGSSCWLVLWRWDRLDLVEKHLQGRRWHRMSFDGMPPLIVYHVEKASKEKASAPGASQKNYQVGLILPLPIFAGLFG